ncbi:bifunctional tRNA (5-methylaminomethyl-2-thiouridine)(34)-methyltransferase MnmD/FAD-dependent 5-carboxymethylaminomethyl-2-thiouridine(34) oxidoreductase MnmC [Vibrio ulleungensis]|uniref:tRNA 5-methylaminomethyl-2-thiouridine biosynthesis bifunctional protein MnmC n=1 Tax=Vibrio ulleungensis TaxID=2807619 RepID=A0ABS2HIG4_9VIBR|nr:bifunctional tRNA (5-methylaminomethyl-2-thiouridine)(34)-methyltransferase MnmD/FAD-dependent 5-carboxymethylaminomethyl-2-thiouridine(34) oxidoreductase MnmC [Vibrio ulleungensis]MBM7036262.1 bifunctional tRNA (5-methylaminomethyl-2-thiouridine)(34)-methyltransferase MnmD/FAD-dependent 5-carboxymethylaminomethyl-2-thiouridine(34) oxidoreductase MnmC [Vibrio ulleungensis]
MTQIKNAKLEWNDAGTPVSEQFDDVYFSNVNGLNESRYVFIEQNQLPQRLFTHDRDQFVVAETGFGTGLNFLALWEVYEQALQESELPRLHFISFEKFPVTQEDLVKAHQRWPELAHYAKQLQQQYPLATAGCHRLSFLEGRLTLDLWFGDIKTTLPNVPCPADGLVDAWFLDGFAPSKNPDMWSQELFTGMVNLGHSGCTVATFTAAGFVRRGLIEAGFEMRKGKGFGTKRDMLIGSLPHSNAQATIASDLPRHGMQHSGSSNESDEVAIIGGGIASVVLAQALLKRGKRVTLYCKDEQLAQGASKNVQGALYPLLSATQPLIHQLFCSAYQYALNFYKQSAEQVEFDHDWCGVVQLLWSEKQATKLGKIRSLSLPTELVTFLNVEQTNQVTGLTIDKDSLLYSHGGWLAPQQLVQGLAKYLSDTQALTVQTNCEVVALDKAQNWQLTLANGETRDHSCVVIANGHLFDKLLPTNNLPLTKVKGQVSNCPTTPTLSQLNTVLCYDGYMTPKSELDQHHRIGASYDRGNIDEDFDQTAQLQNKVKLETSLPDGEWTSDVDVSGNLAKQGIRCVSRDHLPFVGGLSDLELQKQRAVDPSAAAPQYQNVYALLGLGSRGLTTAPLLAEVLAAQMCHEPLPLSVELLEAIDPSRMWVRKIRKGKPIV